MKIRLFTRIKIKVIYKFLILKLIKMVLKNENVNKKTLEF